MLQRTLFHITHRFTSRVGFIGAGSVNFGGAEGPWDHSLRLEQFANSREFGKIEVVAIADTNFDNAQNIINKKQSQYEQKKQEYEFENNKSDIEPANVYENCQAFQSWQDMINDDQLELNTIIIGTPPASRGSLRNNYNMELKCIQKGYDILVEKPLSMDHPQDFIRYAIELNDEQTKIKSKRCPNRNSIICVGYMFRYHRAIEKMREILGDRRILHLNMRYECAYPHINKQFFFDQKQSGGPIVEQGTHFVDIARYLCGECLNDSLHTNAVYFGDNGLNMMHKDVKLHEIENGFVNQIITCMNWKSSTGAVISLSHGIHLHGKKYESYIDLWADGITMNLSNPYHDICYLRVRDSSGDRDVECKDIQYEFNVEDKRNDPYWQEMKCFLASINSENNDNNTIKSDYNDAAYTYILTQDIQSHVMAKSPRSKYA